MHNPEIRVLPDPAAIAQEAAMRIEQLAEAAIELRGRFCIALSGGSTPKLLYQLLAEKYRDAINWAKVEVFFSDERCVPPDHPDSNYRMAYEALLSEVPIPGDNIYRMRGEIEPNEAAKEYGQMLKEKCGDGGLDMVLLGMGEDGHTASLFPETEVLDETKHRCVAVYVSKLKAWRITLTAPFINQSRAVMILVSGKSKAATLQQVLEGPRDPRRFPIQLIDPRGGKLTWFIDSQAAGMEH